MTNDLEKKVFLLKLQQLMKNLMIIYLLIKKKASIIDKIEQYSEEQDHP
jgi:hypothetical protein